MKKARLAIAWVKWGIFLCFAMVLVQPAHALASDCAQVRARLAQQWRRDSTQVAALALDLQNCYTQSGEVSLAQLSVHQVDTLLRIFGIGIAHDPAQRAFWMRERAALGLQRPGTPPQRLRAWLLEAISEAPQDAPPLFFSQALSLLIADYRANKLPLEAIVAQWAQLDREMLLRELGTGEDAPRFAALHKHFRWEMRRTLPDCSQLLTQFSSGIAQRSLEPQRCKTFLVLYDLQGCDAPALWEAALAMVLQEGDPAWLQRLAGAEAFNRGEWAESRLHWQRASELETEPRLRANDALQIAQSWLAEHDYRRARTAILSAMQLHPSWGEPYVRLMDLYLEGSAECTLAEFDQKALYWLLIDLCQELQQRDPNYAVQAVERLYLYRSLAPSLQEAAFLGFKPGDTVPIKCWMSTVTTVPLD